MAMDKVRDFYQRYSGLGKTGQSLPQNGQGFRVGMANGNGLALALGNGQELVELPIDGVNRLVMIQKYVAPGIGNALPLGLGGGNASWIGQAVNKEEIALGLEALHQPAHGLSVAGQQTAHVVVDAHNVWHTIQIVEQGAKEALPSHVDAQSALVQLDSMQGLHRQVQDGFLVLTLSLAQQILAMGCLGQDGVGDVARQGQGGQALGLAVAHVVDDDGDAGVGKERAAKAQEHQQQEDGFCNPALYAPGYVEYPGLRAFWACPRTWCPIQAGPDSGLRHPFWPQW